VSALSSGNAAGPCKGYVAGHGGMVGSALVRRLEKFADHSIITRSHRELDLTRQNEVEAFFADECIDRVYLAAAKVGGIKANRDRNDQ